MSGLFSGLFVCVHVCVHVAWQKYGLGSLRVQLSTPVSCLPWPRYVEGIYCHLFQDCLKWSEPQKHKK